MSRKMSWSSSRIGALLPAATGSPAGRERRAPPFCRFGLMCAPQRLRCVNDARLVDEAVLMMVPEPKSKATGKC